jgi:hypothetical protein
LELWEEAEGIPERSKLKLDSLEEGWVPIDRIIDGMVLFHAYIRARTWGFGLINQEKNVLKFHFVREFRRGINV